jgi:predicted nucleic acid-binding protein
MGKKYILDANAVIDYVGNKLPSISALAMDKLVNDQLNTSIVVKIEVLGFSGEDSEMEKLNEFLGLSTIFFIDDAVAEKAIDLRKSHRKLKLGDAVIAATALLNNFILLSRNSKDFQGIKGLECFNPHELT